MNQNVTILNQIVDDQRASIKFWRELAEGLMKDNAALRAAQDMPFTAEFERYRLKDVRKS